MDVTQTCFKTCLEWGTGQKIAYSASCPYLSRSTRDTRGNYSSALKIQLLLDNEDGLPQNKFVINYCLN